jgi:hypothetical protein
MTKPDKNPDGTPLVDLSKDHEDTDWIEMVHPDASPEPTSVTWAAFKEVWEAKGWTEVQRPDESQLPPPQEEKQDDES